MTLRAAVLAILFMLALQPCMGQDDKGKVYDYAPEMPQFPGGLEGLKTFLHTQVKYPPEAEHNGIEGRPVVTFIVETDGSVSNVSVMRSANSLLDAEAVRVVKAMPRWTPGKKDGEAVRVHYTLPFTFRMGKSNSAANQGKAAGDSLGQGKSKIWGPPAEVTPTFPGGAQALKDYLSSQLKYPRKARKKHITGRVVTTFRVMEDGTISDVKVAKSVEKSLDAEAVRVVSGMPKWLPGKINGKCVPWKYTLPVTFKL